MRDVAIVSYGRTGITKAQRDAQTHGIAMAAHVLREAVARAEKTNVNGGASALGHPDGMSGIRYIGQTLMELGRRDAKKAVIGVCTAGGMGAAAYLER